MDRKDKSKHFTVRDDDGSLRRNLAKLSGLATQMEGRPVSRTDILKRLVDQAMQKMPAIQ